MGAIPEIHFTVREAAWHDADGSHVLGYYPGKEEAMRLAGHDWNVLELRSFTEYPNDVLIAAGQSANLDGNGRLRADSGYVTHVRSDNLHVLAKARDTFERINNSIPYDFAEVLLDEGFVYDAAGSLNGGAQCYMTLLLNEPIVIPGDDSVTLPYVVQSWAHDGSMSWSLRSTQVRAVCQNTISAGEAEGKRLGTNFVFRHTKNVHSRIEEAKETIRGARRDLDVYAAAMSELAELQVTPAVRDLFVSEIIGDRGGVVSTSATVSDRVKSNLE